VLTNRPDRVPWTTLGVVLLMAALFALPAAASVALKHSGEDAIETQNSLQSVKSEMLAQDGLEWRLISGRVPPAQIRGELLASRVRADRYLARAIDHGLPASMAAQVDTLREQYSQAVDREVQLLAAGDGQQALEVDESLVDPAFKRAEALLDMETGRLGTSAERAQSNSDIGILLTILLSLILVSVVQSRRRRAKVSDRAQRRSEARYRTLIDKSSDLVLVVDRGGLATFASPSAERVLAPAGNDHPAVAGAPPDPAPFDLLAAVDARDRSRLSAALQTAAGGSRPIGEYLLSGRHGNGTYELTLQDLTADPSVGGLVLTGHDVTERLALHHELEHRALHDELTGLPNRALLFDRFERALLGAKSSRASVGLLLLDLERFKEVNDTFGHHYGDELLRQIGPRLAGELRDVDTIARLGGDEFAVLLPEVQGEEATIELATNLLATLTTPFQVEGVDLDVEASIGVVISGEHGEDVITLMQHADVAMYVAKAQHLGVFAYDPTVDGHSASKLAMVGELRRALANDELLLYYQPKVSISTGELVGAEALIRWRHPRYGLVLPDDFIPIAERTGLINPLTRYVLDAALTQARAWVDSGRPVPIAVNLSARNLHDEHFAELVADLLTAHVVPAELLELEVTESAIMIDPDRARQMLEKLSALGVRLSLDDFGAGYTSLSQLKALPIDEIKIDRSFVITMAQDRSDSVIVASIIALGHNLEMTLVGEGVETETALRTLAGFGCDVAQGTHICEPLPVGAFDTWRTTVR
jgi:diguanylate cyclase (GGDEF)-like protein